MKNKILSNDVGVTLGGGSIQHPLSIHSASIGTRWKPRGMQLICTLVLLFTFSIGQMWAVDPDYESYDWSSAEAMAAGIAGNTYVTISVVTGGSDGNVSGHQYKALNGAIDGSATGLGTYLSISSTYQIDSVEIFFCPNGTSNTNLAWAGWGKNVTPSAEVGTNYGNTASVKSSKSWDNATWQKIKVSDKSLYTLRISRQGKNLTNSGTKISNFGDNQTVNLLGLRVWLHKYTVTLNPNGGSYASTPEGWTLSEGKYKKAVLAGSLALPEPAYSGNTFAGWKNKNNEVVASPITVSKDTVLTAQWTPQGGTTHNITYTNTKGATNTNPDTYYEGTGIASFNALDDVADFHFNGWSPASIAADATTDQTISATWVAAYNVTFSAGAGSGTVPSTFQKWEGATFDLPDQGSMVAPSGKAFDGWKANGTGDKLAEGYEYTMSAAAVNFVAQWKAVPTTLYSLTVTNTSSVNLNNGGAQNDLADDATIVGGGAYMQNDHASSAQQILSSTKLQFKAGTITLVMTLNNALKEGDTIKATGLNSEGLCFGVTFDRAGSLDNQLASDASYFIVPEEFEGKTTLYAWRHSGSGTTCASIIIRRPAERPIASTVITLSDMKVNNRSISSDSLAILAANHSLTLGDEFVTAPEIKFTEHKVITYADELLPATKVTDKVYTVTASAVSDNWQAQQEINAITYTVTAPKQSSAKVSYYDGETKLGEETVAINGNPAEYADYQDKEFATFVSWYSNSDLAEEHKIVDIAAFEVTEATNVYGKWAPAYASSINIEQWVLDNGVANNTFRAELTARHYKYNNLNNLDSLNDDPTKPYRNYAYLGQKVNKTDSEISFLLKSGSTLKVRFGHLGSNINVIYGTDDPIALTSADYANDAPGNKVYEYTATADVLVKFQCNGTSTSVFKQIMIDEPIADVVLPAIVTLDANGGTYADATVKYTGTPLVIGDATPADEDQVFAGWFDGEDQIDASAYVPTKNVTLVAHYANKPYTVTYVGGEGATGSMAPVDVAWGEDYTALACGFEKENHSFVSWAVTGVTGITEIAAGSAFVMPKGNVTLTAQWVNEALVARIGENYYESLPAAVAAATDGQTVYLLKDVAAGPGVMIETANAKDITIDFGDHTYIVSTPAVGSTNTKTQGFHFEQGCTITMQNGTIGSTGDEVKMLVQNYCDLTLINIKLDGTDLAGTGRYTLSNNCGNVVIGNGAEIVAQAGGVAFDVCYYASYPSVSVTVLPGASIDGKIEMSMSNGKAGVEENCQLIITGGEFENFSISHTNIPEAKVNAAISAGTFDAPVENLYCAENYVPSEADPVTGKYTVEPKEGVCIIKGIVGNDTFVIDEEASLFAGTADKNNVRSSSSTYEGKTGWKFNSRPARLGLTLSGDETFQEGDVVEVFVTSVADIQGNNDKMRIFDATDATAAHVLVESEADMIQGANRHALPATTTKSLYLHRTNDGAYDNFNPFVAYVAVYRAMMPKLTAITINGRTGVIDEANKTVAVQIPYEADLAALTIVDEVVWNAPHATTPKAVISNESAWIEGDNTYRLMDKDGDYTDYIITLTRDVLKHTVNFNTHGGSAVDPQLVVDGESPVAPVAPTKEDYLFQYWAETEDGTEVDVTSVAITADKEFHAVWASDGAIKLLDGATVNHTNYITGVTADETVEFMGNTVNYAKFSGTVSGVNGVKDLTRVIAYNATTNKTKIQISAHNNSTSGRSILVKGLVEGASAAVDLATIALGNKEDKVSEWIEFNNAANRTIYIMVSSSAGDVYFTQVKVIESGETEMKQVGEAGYALNLNKGRFFGLANTDLAFEGLNARLSGDYTALNSGYAKLNATSMSFTVASDMNLVVTTNNSKTYYVTKDAPGTDNETAKTGVSEFDLTAGTWYITAGSSEVQFTNIAFELPKCEKPVITTEPVSKLTFDPGDMTATVVAAEPTEGTLSYQWYNASDDSEVDGATDATLTTTTEGTYYVIVTNSLAGHQDNSTKSAEATLGYRVTNDATLSALSYGGTAITLEDGVYEYDVNLAKGTTEVPALAATATMNGYATVTISNAAEFVSYAATSTVTVKSEDLTVTNVYTVNFTVKHDLPQVDVTATTTWDMTNVSANHIELTGDDKNARLLLANIDGVNNTTFNAQALMFEGQHIGRTDKSVKHLAGRYVQFNVTVPGAVFVTFESNGNNARTISINGKKCARTTSGTAANDYITYALAVEPGSVEIIGYEGESANQYVRISKIEFKAEYSYHRAVNPSFLGTLCWTNNAVLGGATLYEFAGKNEYNYLVFDEVAENRLEAGKPYIFMPENGNTEIKVYNTDNEDALTEADLEPVNNMYGTVEGKTLVPGQDDNMYYFSSNHIWAVKDFVVNINVPAYYCYVDYAAVLAAEPAPAPAPGRRRVTMGVNGKGTATGIDAINASEKPMKLIIDGQMFILRGQKMFDATGRLVK